MIFLALTLAAQIFVDVDRGEALIKEGATVLDARGDRAKAPFLPNARAIDWMDMRDGIGRTGRLDDDLVEIGEELAASGVVREKAILIYGSASRGFGEEGRIWWTLAYFGFKRAFILDGGIDAWVASKKGATALLPEIEDPPQLALTPNTMLRATIDRVEKSGAAVLDVRTREEWNGATLYFESRGGHIPGAHWLDWKTLLDKNGRVLPKPEIFAKARAAGLEPEKPVITYCTGGVRSAFALAVLLDAGFKDVANYDGSWFEWSVKREAK